MMKFEKKYMLPFLLLCSVQNNAQQDLLSDIRTALIGPSPRAKFEGNMRLLEDEARAFKNAIQAAVQDPKTKQLSLKQVKIVKTIAAIEKQLPKVKTVSGMRLVNELDDKLNTINSMYLAPAGREAVKHAEIKGDYERVLTAFVGLRNVVNAHLDRLTRLYAEREFNKVQSSLRLLQEKVTQLLHQFSPLFYMSPLPQYHQVDSIIRFSAIDFQNACDQVEAKIEKVDNARALDMIRERVDLLDKQIRGALRSALLIDKIMREKELYSYLDIEYNKSDAPERKGIFYTPFDIHFYQKYEFAKKHNKPRVVEQQKKLIRDRLVQTNGFEVANTLQQNAFDYQQCVFSLNDTIDLRLVELGKERKGKRKQAGKNIQKPSETFYTGSASMSQKGSSYE